MNIKYTQVTEETNKCVFLFHAPTCEPETPPPPSGFVSDLRAHWQLLTNTFFLFSNVPDFPGKVFVCQLCCWDHVSLLFALSKLKFWLSVPLLYLTLKRPLSSERKILQVADVRAAVPRVFVRAACVQTAAESQQVVYSCSSTATQGSGKNPQSCYLTQTRGR